MALAKSSTTLLRLGAVLLAAIVTAAIVFPSGGSRDTFVAEVHGIVTPPPSAYMHKRSSCFSCERALPAGEEWRGQPSKCFSCERQMAQAGGDAPFMASRTWHAT